jgi:hypothetical protein
MASKTVTAAVKVSIEGKEYKAAMREINRENKEFKKQQKEAMKQAKLSAEEGFGGVIALAKKMAPAISAGAAALKVANTAMLENQRFTDEWARITESAKASYESFVDSLVNGDFSGFFTRMNDVINAAREAADAIDALDTTKIFSDAGLAKINLDIAKYKSILRLGQGSPEELAATRKSYEEALQKMQDISLDKASANIGAFGARLAEYVTNKGFSVSAADFLTTDAAGRNQMKSGSLYEKYYKDLATYLDWDARYKAEAERRKWVTEVDASGRVVSRTKGKGEWSDAAFEEARAFMELSDDKLKELLGYLKQAWADQASVYNAMTQSARYMNGGTGGSKGAGGSAAKVYAEGSIGWMEQEIAKYREQLKSATQQLEMDEASYWIKRYERDIKALTSTSNSVSLGGVANGISISDKYGKWGELPKVNLKPMPVVPITQIDANKDLAKSGETAAEGIMLVSDTLQQLGIMSNVADEGLRTTMRVVGRFLGMIGGFIGGPVGKGISAIGSLVGSFSGGGIVGGTSYTGDRLTARVNSGEMILNATQQRSLFQMLNGGGSTGGGSSVVRGEDIYLVLRNYGRRTGKIHLP